MNAQVETPEVVEVEVPEVEIPGGQKKFKLVVNVPVETEVNGETYEVVAEVEFGPFDTPERVEGEEKKFLDQGYATRVATIFTCSSVRLALAALPRIEVTMPGEPEVAETESKSKSETESNETAVAAILAEFDAKDLREGEEGFVVDPAEAAALAEAEEVERQRMLAEIAAMTGEDEAESAEAAKPAPKPRRSRRTAATA